MHRAHKSTFSSDKKGQANKKDQANKGAVQTLDMKKLCSVKFLQFHDMLNESERYRFTANGPKLSTLESQSLPNLLYMVHSQFP